MPLNESRGYTRSNLTKEEKREALEAIYGLHSHPMPQAQLSPEQLEQMRALLAQYDAEKNPGIKEFDLNNPPKLPYRYEEFPRVVYHHAKRTSRIAHDEHALHEALAHGWSKEPYPAEIEPLELDAEIAAELAAAEAKLRAKKK